MKTRESKIEDGSLKLGDGRWQGRAGTLLPVGATNQVGRRCRAAGVGAPTPYLRRTLLLRLGVLAVLALSTLNLQLSTALAQSYSIDWYKIAGGGGTSSNGQYTVSGTIGQPDATANGALTGGNYSLTGGFWALISVVLTPGAPTLYVSHSGNTVTVYWQDMSGWTLHQNGNLANTNGWSLNTSWATSNGTNYLNITPPMGNLFFRLSNP